MNSNTILIAGGGTGGHIYPGIAVARAIAEKSPDTKVVFVGSPQGLETKIVPRSGYDLELIPIGKLNHAGGAFSKLKTLLRLPQAFWKCLLILKKYKPKSVLGVGGYASGPLVLVASLLGIPTAIWEANAVPGLTNRWLAHFVRRAYLVFAQAGQDISPSKVRITGLPVRKEIEILHGESADSVKTEDEFRILVFGGSQGARFINKVVSEAVLNGGDWLKGIKFIHQTGAIDFTELSQKYKGQPKVDVLEFIYDMENQYPKADLVICRAGASTVTEIAASGRPAIFVPLPTAADNHQQKNSELFVAQGAGIQILQNDLNPESLVAEIVRLRKNPEERRRMGLRAKQLFQSAAAEKMADDLLSGIPK